MFGLAAMVAIISAIVPGETGAAAKLFWFDCGPAMDCSKASLYYVDPEAATPTKTLFMSGVGISRDNRENHSIPTGTVEPETYQISNLKTGYVLYFKGGKIYSVDTTTLTSSQLSNETGISATQLCEFQTFTDWLTPLNSTIYYDLAGVDNLCYSDDDVQRAVKLNTGSTSAPISLSKQQIAELLLDGTYLVWDWNTSPNKVKICESDLTTCAQVTTTEGQFWSHSGGFDASRVLFMVDGTWDNDNYLGGKLMIYDYGNEEPSLVTLYTPAAGEMVGEVRLDRDGFVYFVTLPTTSPYTGKLKKVAYAGGTVTTLSTFTLPGLVSRDSVWIDLSPSYVVFFYPNNTSGTAVSVEKETGTVVTLASGFVNGGVVGEYLYYEDLNPYVRRKQLDGTGLISKSSARLVGVSLGGSADWHYRFNTSTWKGLIQTNNNQLRAYTTGDNISVASAGILLGAIPANLSNVRGDGWDNNMLMVAEKRNTDFSYGTDILLFDAGTASSVKRMTNTNGPEGSLSNADF